MPVPFRTFSAQQFLSLFGAIEGVTEAVMRIRFMSALSQKQTLGRFRPKTRDQKWSSNCGAPHMLIGAVRFAIRPTASRAVEATNDPAV